MGGAEEVTFEPPERQPGENPEQSIQALGPASTKPGGRQVFPARKKLARAEGGAASTVSEHLACRGGGLCLRGGSPRGLKQRLGTTGLRFMKLTKQLFGQRVMVMQGNPGADPCAVPGSPLWRQTPGRWEFDTCALT